MNSIHSVHLAQPAVSPRMPHAIEGQADQASFKDFLLDSVEHVNQMQVDANQAMETLMTGGDVDPAEVLTAVQKADLAFRLMMQVRNKLTQVYQEIRDIRI